MRQRNGRHDDAFESEDIPALVVEVALRGMWALVLLACSVVRAAAGAPIASAALLVLTGVAYWFGWLASMAVLTVVVVTLVAWRFLRADSYRTAVGPRVVSVWRSPAYRLWFPHVARRCGLMVQHYGAKGESDRETARLLRVRVGPGGHESLLLRLPAGMTAADVEQRLPALADALGARRAGLRLDRPGRVWLDLRRGDALTRVVPPHPRDCTDLEAVPVGVGEDGTDWCLRIRGTHTLIAGATGAGKGSVLWSLVAGLRTALIDGSAEIWAIDPKGGMELGLGRRAFARFEGGDPEAMCELLEEAVDLKTRRSLALATAGVRTHEPRKGSPHIVVVVDELATLTAFAERSVVRRIENALGLLLTQGRAVGISVVAAVQDPGKDVVHWRDLFPTRIAMRLDNAIQVDMVLGEGGRDRGAAADEISEHSPGVAFVRVEGTREIRRVRASYLDDEAVIRLADEISTCRQESSTTEEEEVRGAA